MGIVRLAGEPLPVGFAYKTKGGFWRGYCYRGVGYGPFDTKEAAEAWVVEEWQAWPLQRRNDAPGEAG